ncbi:MAG TPA: metal ABC transporter ATP-binding protein [Candidatus Sumerlaeota bacterium]|nr:metal ABC transporter ATP-binding protein [Candidatus Sumerlaeota bacterium]
MSLPSPPPPDIEVKSVSFRYGKQWVLEDVDLTVTARDFVGLIGPNGGGKTTLLRIILGLLRPDRGQVRLFGLPPAEGCRGIGYVPQHIRFDFQFPISVMDVVLMGRLRHAPRLGRYKTRDRELAEQALEQLGVIDLRRRAIGELSGGQRQRVLIARALAGEPRLLALDEPTSSVDGRVEREVFEMLHALNERITILLVTHELGFISSYVKTVACLSRKLVCHPTSGVTGDVIEELYGGHVHMVRHDHVGHGTDCVFERGEIDSKEPRAATDGDRPG